MDYRKYILNSLDHVELVKEFIEWSLKGMTDKSIEINENIILIDTLHTIEELVEQFKGTDVNIIDVTESNNFDTLDFTIETNIKIAEAKKELDISDDINYFLDLIETRGHEYLLTGKEQQRLHELTKNFNQ